jgi:hypothetical protein
MRTKSRHLTGCLAALGAFSASFAFTGNAAAATCPTFDHPLVVVGSSAVSNFVAKIGGILKSEATPIDVLYQKPGSCVGAGLMLDPSSPGVITGDVSYYDEAGGTYSCTLAEETAVDIGVSDVFADTCDFELQDGVGEFRGPVQSMTFAASTQSSQTVMSYEAAYLALGVGDTDPDFLYNDATKLWFRDKFSGTQQMIAHAIGVPGDKFNAAGHSTNAAGIISALQASASDIDVATATFGILGVDALRPLSDVVPLAYQHKGQTCGYYPDSELTKKDMQNTRDGHYFIQGPVHMFTKIDNDGTPTNDAAKLFVDYLSGSVESEVVVQEEAKLGIVPQCAMHVARDSEAGAFYSFAFPGGMCDCAWLHYAQPSELPSECTTCDAANDQSDGTNSDCEDSTRAHCHYGYCEVI